MDNLSKWVKHNFQKPKRSVTPVTSLHIVWPGDRLPRVAHPKRYTGNKVTVESNGRGVKVHVDGNAAPPFSGMCTLRFGAALGYSLGVGGYGGVVGYDPLHEYPPPYSELRLGSTSLSGWEREFVVWELEVRDYKIIRLAIDFINDSSSGSLRFNSLFRPAVPVSDASQ
jgi:hypothetical protein